VAAVAVTVDSGSARITSRNGNDVTASYPDLAVGITRDRTVVLDGEIVALDAGGLPDTPEQGGDRYAPRPSAAESLPACKSVSEHAGKPIVRSWGLPVAQGILAEDVDGALAAARTIGDTVVAKVSALALAHKTELGLVEIGIADDHAMAIVAERLLRLAGAGAGAGVVVAGPIDGILVEPMIADALEMVVGVIHDPDVGPVIMIGAGGT
jgi:acyl-CoA synthetase (NDP forming)